MSTWNKRVGLHSALNCIFFADNTSVPRQFKFLQTWLSITEHFVFDQTYLLLKVDGIGPDMEVKSGWLHFLDPCMPIGEPLPWPLFALD